LSYGIARIKVKSNWHIENLLTGVASVICLLCALKSDASSRPFAMALFMLPFVVTAFYAAKEKKLNLLRLCTAVIGIRLVVVYFEIFGSLALTGFGLILSGVVLIGGVAIWKRLVGNFE